MTLVPIVLAWSTSGASTALWAYARSRGRAEHEPCATAPVLLLRPCAGEERHLAHTLLSSRAAPAGSRVRILVADASDPATAVARRAAADLRGVGFDASVVLTAARTPNRKVGQLAAGVAAERSAPPIVLVADSDVELTEGVIADLTAPLVAGEAAAAWAPPIETEAVTLGDRASASVLDASLHAFALLSALDPRGMVGKAFAIRRDALERAGGFRALTAVLGEDMELARRLRAAGLRVAVTGRPAASRAAGRSWGEVAARYARWLTVLRAQRPLLLVTYPLLLAAAPLQLALAFAGLARGEPGAAWAVGLVIASRVLLALLARRRSRLAIGDVLVAPWLADALLLVALGRAISRRTVSWRGVLLRATRGGPLSEVER